MPKALPPRLDEVLPPASYSFLVLELAFKNESDVPGLLRYKLEAVLPRGLEGLCHYYRRIGRTRRFLVTLVREASALALAPEKTRLPFALSLPGSEDREIEWTASSVSFLARYEEGGLVSLEPRSKADNETEPYAASGCERREALLRGPAMHRKAGKDELVWKIAAWALAIGIAAQLAILVSGNILSRKAELAALEEKIAILSRNAPAEGAQLVESGSGSLQSRAGEIYASVSSKWKKGYYLSKWSLKGERLRLEGWGPDALSLLSSLREDPELASLVLSSRKDESGYELFAFEAEADHD